MVAMKRKAAFLFSFYDSEYKKSLTSYYALAAQTCTLSQFNKEKYYNQCHTTVSAKNFHTLERKQSVCEILRFFSVQVTLLFWLLLPRFQNSKYYNNGDEQDQYNGNHHAFP